MVVASGHPPVAPCAEAQLSVRHGREAVTCYEAAFGVQACFRRGGTDELPGGVAQLEAGSTRFWVEGGVHPVAGVYGWLLGRVVDPFGHHREIGRPLGPWPSADGDGKERP